MHYTFDLLIFALSLAILYRTKLYNLAYYRINDADTVIGKKKERGDDGGAIRHTNYVGQEHHSDDQSSSQKKPKNVKDSIDDQSLWAGVINVHVPFFYIYTPSTIRTKLGTKIQNIQFHDSVDNVEPPFLNLIKAAEQYHSNAEKVVAAMVANAEVAKKSEWVVFDNGTNEVPQPKNIHKLSTKLEEKARKTAALLEQNYFVLQDLLKPFRIVQGLPSSPSDYENKHHHHEKGVKAAFDFATDFNFNTNITNGMHSSSSYDSALQILTHIVRDWSPLGQRIRESLFDWVIDKLLIYRDHMKNKPILVPGAGLGRLAFEINQKGFHVEANEISIVMAAAANRFLNGDVVLQGEIFPFVDDFTINEVNSQHRYQNVMFQGAVKKPINNSSLEEQCTEDQNNFSLSYTIGDFIQIYASSEKVGLYGSIVTCFFIDTATNIYEYVLVIRKALMVGGKWINVGPLQWHGNSKLHVSGDELRIIIESMGFIIHSWGIDEEIINYRHDDLHEQHRYTKYEGYKPIRFVATLN